MNIALVGILDQVAPATPGSVDASTVVPRVRAAVEANLHRAPMLRRILHETKLGEGTAVWVDDPAFNLTHQVVLARPDVPVLDEESFVAWCAGRSAMPLERSRPLWRMDVVPGLPSGRVGILLVLHHVVADGVRGVGLVGSLLDTVPGGNPREPLGVGNRSRPRRARIWSGTTLAAGSQRCDGCGRPPCDVRCTRCAPSPASRAAPPPSRSSAA